MQMNTKAKVMIKYYHNDDCHDDDDNDDDNSRKILTKTAKNMNEINNDNNKN